MKNLIFLLMSVYGLTANAKTYGIFKESETIVIVQGQDSDAKTLYNALNVEPTKNDNLLRKEVTLTARGEAFFTVLCNSSTTIDNTSCTIAIAHNEFSSPNKESKSILFGINDRTVVGRVASLFNHVGDKYQGHVLQSEDTKLHIWKTFDANGKVVSFTLDYQGLK